MSKFIRVCQHCKDEKKVRAKKDITTHCFKCQAIWRRISHFRICLTCKDVKQVDRIQATEYTKCSKCHTKEMRTHRKLAPINHYICHVCPSIRITKLKKKSNYCGDCNRRRDRNKEKGSYDLHTMTYKPLIIVKKVKVKVKKKKTVKVLKTKKLMTDANLAKVREINRLHREANKQKKELIVDKDQDWVDDTISKWLANNKPSIVLDKNEVIPHMHGKCAYINNSTLIY